MVFFKEEDCLKFPDVPLHFIKAEQEGYVFTITLNRPEKRNAFTPTMAAEIAFALAYASIESSVRVVVLKAAGSVFCAGADLNAFHDASVDIPNAALPAPLAHIRLGDAFKHLHKPCIAQVEGSVFAGGFLIICGATFVVSVPEATFSLPEVKRGIWPMQVMASLLEIMPKRKVLEICMTGRAYRADDAMALGLVTEMAEANAIANHVQTLANELSQSAPLAIQSGLRALNGLDALAEDERHAYLKTQLDVLLRTEDAKEGVAAFREKRSPQWRGR